MSKIYFEVGFIQDGFLISTAMRIFDKFSAAAAERAIAAKVFGNRSKDKYRVRVIFVDEIPLASEWHPLYLSYTDPSNPKSSGRGRLAIWQMWTGSRAKHVESDLFSEAMVSRPGDTYVGTYDPFGWPMVKRIPGETADAFSKRMQLVLNMTSL
jgi:hypothetical protein